MHGFDWNEGNKEKSWEKHRVSVKECEEAFFNHPIIIYKDIRHSFDEERYVVLGRTNVGRKLHIAFTIRDKKIRVISARDQIKKERKFYESKSQ